MPLHGSTGSPQTVGQAYCKLCRRSLLLRACAGAKYCRAFCMMLRIKVKASLLGLACGRGIESYDESTIRSNPAWKKRKLRERRFFVIKYTCMGRHLGVLPYLGYRIGQTSALSWAADRQTLRCGNRYPLGTVVCSQKFFHGPTRNLHCF